MSISANEFENDNSDSENLDESLDYYQPISADDESDEDANNFDQMMISDGHIEPEIGIHTLNLNNEEEDEETVVEEEEAADSEISRAFMEDENRRNAPLTPENSNRIMDAMRGISFQGFVPDWINQVPEDRWIDQLRNLRPHQQQPDSTTRTTQNQ
ncbi:hypothetical protein MKW94_002899 [Papaver nudicaule]|uniref:Male-enhanced antigen 1 n=1 Tax=Papaver nudicaule TaxID=74823 RepID=A0AA41VZ48_PAPNU|nr:hypothetical protein [Papaver nudicaule]